VQGQSLTANLDGFVPLGFKFPDGSGHGTGSITGTLQARATINATTTFQTDSGSPSNGTLNLTFDKLYNRASSLTTLSGNFTNPANNVVVTNGVQFNGLATLDNTVVPERILLGVTGLSGTIRYSVVLQLNRT
jgi:hypothetical protein